MIAVINEKPYRFSVSRHKEKDYLVVELINDAATKKRINYVPQPHPAYKDGEWHPEFFEKLVKSGEITRMDSKRGKAKR